MAVARAAGEELLRSAERVHADEIQWTIPAGYAALSGTAYLGYAHGSAGIADVLLDLTEATGDDRFAKAAAAVARRLARLAIPALDDGSGLEWPSAEGGHPIGPMWCHGSTGVGRFLLHAAALDLWPGALELARRAGRSVALGGRALGPVQCHGLAGSIEFLLDLHAATHEAQYVQDALVLAQLLDGFRIEEEGRLAWCSDRAEVVVPDYMVGFSGIAMCLLRLADPARRPHQLSRAGFRFRP
jgi:lantibiotic modifying enzyme